MKKLVLCTVSALVLAGCANDGSVYRSDVYSTAQVNQAQEVKVVRIISVMPARVAVRNTSERSEGGQVGAILGALAGAAIGATVSDSSDAVIAGTIAGGALGGISGRGLSGRSQNLVDGRQDLQLCAGWPRVRVPSWGCHHDFAFAQRNAHPAQ